MKQLFLTAALALTTIGAMADSPLWLRNTAISPDGKTIAFTYKGDIYTVPSGGGQATRLTAGAGYNSNPFWSPDGTRLVFSSDRMGGSDVYVMPAGGGTPRRLTTHSAPETPLGWMNDSTVAYTARIQADVNDLNAPWSRQTYIVNANREGARPKLFFSLQTRSGAFNSAGDYIFEDWKGFENALRKHEMSSATGDIFLWHDGKFNRLTSFKGNDRNPVWAGDGKYAYTSEQDGTLNVYLASVDGKTPARQLTNFKGTPVRSLSSDAAGNLLAFSYDGEIYTLVPGQQPQKVNVSIVTDDFDSDHVNRFVSGGANNLEVSPTGEELAIIIRGELYVTSVKYPTTKRITNTAGQERTMSFGDDGRSIYYDSERDGHWAIYRTKIKNPAEKNFAYSTELIEEPVYSSDRQAMQPVVSPDGKKLAFLEDRTELKVMDLDTKKVATALDGKYNYSYSDGDVEFTWSPDSKWIAISYIGIGGWNNTDVAIVKADGSEVIDLTESGYSDASGKWTLDGRAITFVSGRNGMKSHGSWGNQSDVYLMALDADAWEKFNMSEEDADLAEKAKSDAEDSDKKDDKADKKKDKKKDKKVKEAPELPFDLANRFYRTRRLTGSSTLLNDYYLSPKADILYYTAPATEGGYNLYKRDLRKDETTILAQGKRGGFVADKKGENIYMFSNGGIVKIDLASGSAKPVEYSAPYDRHPSLEREYMFDHAWQQVKDKFYDVNIHDVDWDRYKAEYRKFLPYVNNNNDFAIVLSELLGELNASHTGASAAGSSPQLSTATLSVFVDPDFEGDGLLIDSIMPRSPLAKASAGVAKGDIILSIDGQPILAGKDYYPLLAGKAGRNTLLEIVKPGGEIKTVTVKPNDPEFESGIRYQMWVARNEALVDSLSGGKIGYVHVQQMNGSSFQTIYSKLLGKYRNCEAVVVDTRFNPGGWLHNDVAMLLSGKEFVRYSPRGQYIGSDPFDRWTKPSVMLVNEANYSDGHGTPVAYRANKIGKIVGAPVPGTMTAVWWEDQIDPSINFGIPEVTSLDMNGKPLENQQLEPDILILNTPDEITTGNDVQLRRAVQELMKH